VTDAGYAGARDFLARLYDAGVIPEGTTRAIIDVAIREPFVIVYCEALADASLMDVRLHPLGVRIVRVPADTDEPAA